VLTLRKPVSIKGHLLIVILFCLLSPTLCDIAFSEKNPDLSSDIIVIGGNFDYPPYEFIDENGKPSGYSTELAKALAEVMGVRVKIVLDALPKTRENLETGKINGIQGMYYSKERDRLFDFSPPHAIVYSSFFSRKDQPDISAIEELQYKKIVVVQKGALHDYIKSKGFNQIVVADSDGEALRLVASGKYDYALLGRLAGIYLINKLKLSNIRTLGPSILPFKYCFAVKEGDDYLLGRINEGLSILKQTGRYQIIYDKWIGVLEPENDSKTITLKFLALLIMVGAVIMIGGFFWVKVLRNQVADRTAAYKRENEERKGIENALSDSEERYRTILEASPVVYIIHQDGHIRYINESGCKLLGGESLSDIQGRVIHDFVDPSAKKGLKQRTERIKEGKSNPPADVDVTGIDGRRVHVQTTSMPFTWEGEVAVLIIAVDITDRKRSEVALRESEDRLRGIFEAADQISFIITDANDPEPTVLEFSPGAENIFGYKRSEIVGQKVSALHLKEDVLKFPDAHREMREGGRSFSGEAVLVRKSGETFAALFSTFPLVDEKGDMYAALGVSIDISLQKELEQQVRQAHKIESIGTLAGGIAHDFNNMLAVITGNVSYSLSLLNAGEELFDVLSDVQDGVRQAQTLTQQLLTFASGGEPVKQVADLNKVIQEAARFVTRGARSKCEFSLDDDLWAADVDPGQINQVIGNLVINANQSMPEGGVINIRAENVTIVKDDYLPLSPGRYIKVSVKDQGTGIPEKHLGNIFDPYFSTKQQGSGLGLASAYSIVNKHSGYIVAESSMDIGSTFFVYLPASEKEVQVISKSRSGDHSGKGKILIMDDEEPILKMAGRILGRMGYDVCAARDGAEAVAFYQREFATGDPFKLVILDLTVPGGMGGAKTIRELLKIDQAVKAVVSSGYSNDPVMANFSEYGFSGVVPKPYTKDQLTEVIISLCPV